MIRISNSIEIQRPVADVFAFIADFKNNPRWMPVLSVEQTSPGGVGAGTTFNQQFHLMGADYLLNSTITGFEPNKKISFTYNAPVFNWQGEYTFEPTPLGTRLHAHGIINLIGALRLGESMFAPKIRKLIADTAPRVKQILEAEQAIEDRRPATEDRQPTSNNQQPPTSNL